MHVYLNYGEGEENQSARNRQLTRHVVPLLNGKSSVVIGDLNFDTGQVNPSESGLEGFVNLFEGEVTCTDLGKHVLRGKRMVQDGKPCSECEEKIDGLIYDPKQVEVLNSCIKALRVGNQLLSDHYAIMATLKISRT